MSNLKHRLMIIEGQRNDRDDQPEPYRNPDPARLSPFEQQQMKVIGAKIEAGGLDALTVDEIDAAIDLRAKILNYYPGDAHGDAPYPWPGGSEPKYAVL